MAKQQISKEGGGSFKSPAYPKKYEKDMERFTTYMVREIAQQYINNTAKELNKGTVEKFADDQVGNYAVIFNTLSNKAKRKIVDRFSNDRIKKAVRRFLNGTNKKNQKDLYTSVEDQIGISTTEMIAKEGLKPNTNALMMETERWVQSLRDDVLKDLANNALRVMSQGASLQQVVDEMQQVKSKRVNNAKFVARNQIAQFNSMSSKIRAQNLGVTTAIWRTAKDERVRPCHQVREGKTFDLSKGLKSSCDGKTLYPGTDYNCRCDYEFVIPELDD